MIFLYVVNNKYLCAFYVTNEYYDRRRKGSGEEGLGRLS